MPFDCTPLFDAPQWPATCSDLVQIRTNTRTAKPIRVRSDPAWDVARRPECTDPTVLVLIRARNLIADERQWCKRAFARTWFDIPIPVQSTFARRFCAMGAIKRAGGELGMPMKDAGKALERQTVRPVADWNDDAWRTHGEVVAAFDAAIAGQLSLV